MIKPKLLDKELINNYIIKNIINKKDSKNTLCHESDNNFFIFLFIVLLIFFILFLIYRYLEKKNNKDI
jgi:hypothetical protein